MTDTALLKQLRAAWSELPPTASEFFRSLERQGVGMAITACDYHMPPFDAVDMIDERRPGWIRSTCRLCGRFLGYRPASGKVMIE